VVVPLKTKFSVYNGDEQTRHYLKFWNLSIPVWGFAKHDYSNFEEETTVRPLYFLQWELPVRYQERTWRSKEEITRVYTKKEAVAEGKRMARSNLDKKVEEDAEIIGEKILHETIDNGKVKLSIHYQVIEDIATGQRIIQGD
jgi:similar to stage IV sporulation protein